MSKIVNLRRVRKAKARAEAATQADANRVTHGVSRSVRNLGKARKEKLDRVSAAHKLDHKTK
jgi:hypothetical protein